MIVWMLYGCLVALIVALAARAADWTARLLGFGVRWIWAGALALTILLSVSAVFRESAPVASPTGESTVKSHGEAGSLQAGEWWSRMLHAGAENVHRSVGTPLWSAAAILHRVVPPAADMYIATLSAVMSVGLVLVFAGVRRRFAKAKHEWPRISIQSVDVRVAPRVGPIVIGFVRPEIVVPRWLLNRSANEQSLVVAHEAEHIRAHDPILLGLACIAVVIAPWNPALWYMLSRLRLAVELDCDARVLRRGVTPQSYGSLLIEVARRASALNSSALALADNSSHLRQRILAMKPTAPRFARLRAGLAGVFVSGSVLVACQATLPSRAEMEGMVGMTSPSSVLERASGGRTDMTAAHTVDGAEPMVGNVVARARRPLGRAATATLRLPVPETSNQATPVSVPLASADSDDESFAGLILIDGVRVTEGQMRSLDRRQILNVKVLKRPDARKYGDPAAAKGVIAIATKRGGASN